MKPPSIVILTVRERGEGGERERGERERGGDKERQVNVFVSFFS